jgi:hypothetical protein
MVDGTELFQVLELSVLVAEKRLPLESYVVWCILMREMHYLPDL